MKFKDWIYHLRFKHQLRKMQRKYNAEKRRCMRQYPDWEDNEYNDLDCKFIWGLPHNKTAEPYASLITWNKATLIYDRRTESFVLDIDTSFFDSDEPIDEHYVNYIKEIREAFNRRYQNVPDQHIEIQDLKDNRLFIGKTIADIKAQLKLYYKLIDIEAKGEY